WYLILYGVYDSWPFLVISADTNQKALNIRHIRMDSMECKVFSVRRIVAELLSAEGYPEIPLGENAEAGVVVCFRTEADGGPRWATIDSEPRGIL
ncbi:hypothetical protein HK405_006805, partial [Cladochytrium tenue]